MKQLPVDFPFFPRNGMTELDRKACDSIASSVFPHDISNPHIHQGYCSYTLIATSKETALGAVSEAHLLQFRPLHYALDPRISLAATHVYRSYAPETTHIGSFYFDDGDESTRRASIEVYDLAIIPGTPYSTSIFTKPSLTAKEWYRQRTLISSFAAFLALSWPTSHGEPPTQPMPTGKVLPAIPSKLRSLATSLPTSALRDTATSALERLPLLDKLPTVLTHGDVVPSNIMLDAETGALRGLVDWAEAEALPFGICLYGLEFLLGYIDDRSKLAVDSASPQSPSSSPSSSEIEEDGEACSDAETPLPGFVYYACAEQLRQLFWTELVKRVSVLEDEGMKEAVQCARDVGVLMWFGYAWDEGSIDRVVDREKDPREVILLETFLRTNSSYSA